MMRQGMRTAMTALAAHFGYAVLPKWRLANRDLAEHLRQLFDRCAIGCVIDVGANTGQYAGFLRDEVGFTGLIVSIEPLAECFDRLERAAAADANWLVVNCALGSAETEATLNVMAYDQLSSFLEPNNDGAPHMAPLNRVCRRVRVPVRRLDAVLAELETDRRLGPIYLKLDTQGFDLEVIKGAGAALPRIRALQTELSVVPIYDRMPDWQTALATLQGQGFELSGLWTVNRDPALRAVEMDCVMVRPGDGDGLADTGR